LLCCRLSSFGEWQRITALQILNLVIIGVVKGLAEQASILLRKERRVGCRLKLLPDTISEIGPEIEIVSALVLGYK
jgi:hypothetical protein